jgi:hypothetical protein
VSFNVACSPACLFPRSPFNPREGKLKLFNEPAATIRFVDRPPFAFRLLRRLIDFPFSFAWVARASNYHASRSGHHRGLPHLTLVLLKHPGRLHFAKPYANRHVIPFCQGPHHALTDQQSLHYDPTCHLRNTAWSEACSRLSFVSRPLVHSICKVLHIQHLQLDTVSPEQRSTHT